MSNDKGDERWSRISRIIEVKVWGGKKIGQVAFWH